MMLTTIVCSKFPHPDQSIPISVNKTPSPLAYETIRFQDVHIKPSMSLSELEDAEQDLQSKIPYGEVRSTSLQIRGAHGAVSKEYNDSEMYYPSCSSLEDGMKQGLVIDNQSSENSDKCNKDNASSDSVMSEKYYTPEEEELSKYLSDHSVSFEIAFSEYNGRKRGEGEAKRKECRK